LFDSVHFALSKSLSTLKTHYASEILSCLFLKKQKQKQKQQKKKKTSVFGILLQFQKNTSLPFMAVGIIIVN
jgi:hypothetical protein